ncbi:MAG: GNAT family N-acetyltransferase [Chloroflexota bacterium]
MKPNTSFETVRLRFRRFTAQDAQLIYDLDDDPEVMRYLTGGSNTPMGVVVEEILPRFMLQAEPASPLGFWAIEEKASYAFVGWVSLRRENRASTRAVLGYRLRRQAWGNGYATEAAGWIMNQAFSQVDVALIVATTYEANLGSRRVMEKLGMRHVRSFRLTPEDLQTSDTSHQESEEVWDGDDVEYAITREEWGEG